MIERLEPMSFFDQLRRLKFPWSISIRQHWSKFINMSNGDQWRYTWYAIHDFSMKHSGACPHKQWRFRNSTNNLHWKRFTGGLILFEQQIMATQPAKSRTIGWNWWRDVDLCCHTTGEDDRQLEANMEKWILKIKRLQRWVHMSGFGWWVLCNITLP